MKKLFVFILLAVFFLSACAAEQPAAATQQPAAIVAADARQATPVVGFVAVRKLDGMEALLLRSQPDPKSPLAGRVAPGESGKLLGVDKTGGWVLIKFTDQTGWAPVEALDLTISQ